MADKSNGNSKVLWLGGVVVVVLGLLLVGMYGDKLTTKVAPNVPAEPARTCVWDTERAAYQKELDELNKQRDSIIKEIRELSLRRDKNDSEWINNNCNEVTSDVCRRLLDESNNITERIRLLNVELNRSNFRHGELVYLVGLPRCEDMGVAGEKGKVLPPVSPKKDADSKRTQPTILVPNKIR